jgi:biotin synthase
LETSRRYFPILCDTHTYDDRVATVRAVKAAGMEVCCGGILGLGESLEDRVDLAFALCELEVDSIPVNLFNPRPGTPLADRPRLGAADSLRGLALFRLVNPTRDLRAAGGREACLGALQPLALFAANSIFTNGYLTTPGQGRSADAVMLEEAGFRPAQLEM